MATLGGLEALPSFSHPYRCIQEEQWPWRACAGFGKAGWGGWVGPLGVSVSVMAFSILERLPNTGCCSFPEGPGCQAGTAMWTAKLLPKVGAPLLVGHGLVFKPDGQEWE